MISSIDEDKFVGHTIIAAVRAAAEAHL